MEAIAPLRPRLRLPRRGPEAASDEQLVAAVRDGDERAFELLYDRHHRGILGFCRHMLGSQEEAEDAVQHTFAAAYRALRADERQIQLKAWLYAIARNRCFSVLRARREEVGLDDAEPSVIGLASEVERRQDLREMLADLQRLPEDQREALVLSELGDLSHDEVAVTLGVRREKVKALVFQARESLTASRRAREADCREMREQLSVLRGGSLRRTDIRRHLELCVGCRDFRGEVQRQRAALAVVLPVVPSVTLKEASLAAAFSGAGAGAGAAGGAAGAAAGAATAGLATSAATSVPAGGTLAAALGAKSLAAKALVAVAVAGGAGGTGYVAVDELAGGGAAPVTRPAAPQSAPPAAATPPAVPDGGAPAGHGTREREDAEDRRSARERSERGRGRSGDATSRRGSDRGERRSGDDSAGRRAARGQNRGRSGTGQRGRERARPERGASRRSRSQNRRRGRAQRRQGPTRRSGTNQPRPAPAPVVTPPAPETQEAPTGDLAAPEPVEAPTDGRSAPGPAIGAPRSNIG